MFQSNLKDLNIHWEKKVRSAVFITKSFQGGEWEFFAVCPSEDAKAGAMEQLDASDIEFAIFVTEEEMVKALQTLHRTGGGSSQQGDSSGSPA